MDASAWIALSSVGLALIVFLMGRLDVRRERGLREDVFDRERADRQESQRLLREELDARRAALELLQRQVESDSEERSAQREADELERAARKKAEITAAQAGYSRHTQFGEYHFKIKNLGPSWAKHITVWLELGAGEPLTGDQSAAYLERGEERTVTLSVPQRAWEQQLPVALWVRWYDESGGPHIERSNLAIRL